MARISADIAETWWIRVSTATRIHHARSAADRSLTSAEGGTDTLGVHVAYVVGVLHGVPEVEPSPDA